MEDTIITSLLQKYINNRCTEGELRVLLNWLKSPDDLACLDKVIHPLWDRIEQSQSYPDSQKESELRMEVSLLLNEIKHKTVEAVPFKVQTLPPHVKTQKLVNSFYRVAVILILAVSVTFGLLTVLNDPLKPITYMEKSSNPGEKKHIVLADGTTVVLNSGTKLRIPSNFNAKERVIEMIGEGFFEVAHNPDKPFIIKSKEAHVSVLGTSFDFKSYAEDDFISVTVSTGKVRVNMDAQDLQLALLPNEHLSINKIDGNIRKQIIEENNYIKWIQGSLFFDKEPIREVIKTINRTYNRKVVLQCNKNSQYIITGTHDNKSIEAVVEAICFTTGLHSREEKGRIIIYDKQNVKP